MLTWVSPCRRQRCVDTPAVAGHPGRTVTSHALEGGRAAYQANGWARPALRLGRRVIGKARPQTASLSTSHPSPLDHPDSDHQAAREVSQFVKSFTGPVVQPWPVSQLTSPRTCPPSPASAFAGFRFPPEVIVVAIRWYFRFNLSTATSGTAGGTWRGGRSRHRLPVGAAVHAAAGRRRPLRPPLSRRSVVRGRDVKVNGVWRYVYRAVDQHGQVIDVPRRARRADPVRLAPRRAARQQIRSRPITASSNTGYDQCAGYERTRPHK